LLKLTLDGKTFSAFHFAGIMGSGMSALAQFLAWNGHAVTGSDRIACAEEMKDSKEKLEQCGCRIFPQDGSGLTDTAEALVISTAIEEDNPDIVAARKRNLPIWHRSDLLAAIVAARRTLAVCGTSGKSTVSAMIFEILLACGKSPSLLTGANLVRLNEEGLLGNAYKGESELLIIEADESDGSLVKYRPDLAVFLNLSKDHNTLEVTLNYFQQLSAQTSFVIKNAEDPGLESLNAARTFGLSDRAHCRPESIQAFTPHVRFKMGGEDFDLPMAGIHNFANALAALCVCAREACSYKEMVGPLRNFRGILRRFAVSRTRGEITVIDDYAHNPEKIKAALLTARDFGNRVFAVFQPHGYGPTCFLQDELVDTFSRLIRGKDEIFFLPIYYAGGTVKKDISSEDLSGRIARRGVRSSAPKDRPGLMADLKRRAKPGDVVILMGARDPSLSLLAREIKKSLE
jgi:UDP-N-acetylmuramate--alanine ligase